MKKLVAILLGAGLLATAGVPFTNAVPTAGAQVGTTFDESGPLPDWYAETVFGLRSLQAPVTGMAKGPAATATDMGAVREPIRFDGEDSRYVNH
ncbi:MAG: hypothetical protein HYV08_10350 [Deltaproteobacteria bacterium]|nr:hypothetical protein [Deltaproteobacteria bacterium]